MRKLLLLTGLIFFGMQAGHAQNEKFKALFMYNFTKYIEWPASAKQGDFIIAVLGSSPMVKELEVIAGKQKVGTQNIIVKTFNSVNEVEMCNILYIPNSKSSQLTQVIEKLAGKSVLVVSDKAGLAQLGSCINFIQDGDRIKFELNKKNIEKTGMSVNSTLTTLGVLVN